MKLLVIVLCLLSERYLVHAVSYYRFHWFPTYFNNIVQRLPQTGFFINPYVLLTVIIVPFILVLWLVLSLLGPILFGFAGFLINLGVFYYCIGPENAFYPINLPNGERDHELAAGTYFTKVNNQLFAVIFWFILTGPLGILFYRMLYLCKDQALTRPASAEIIGLLDWITSRVTLMLYLLVGNFQQGFHYYTQMFLTPPANNDIILHTGGLLAARSHDEEVVTLPFAQSLVEHALIVYLVLIAFCTLVAWL